MFSKKSKSSWIAPIVVTQQRYSYAWTFDMNSITPALLLVNAQVEFFHATSIFVVAVAGRMS